MISKSSITPRLCAAIWPASRPHQAGSRGGQVQSGELTAGQGARYNGVAVGFRGPLWVTETGYPANPAFQTEPGYQDGPLSQALWLTTAIASMLQSDAAMVFVTERDSMHGVHASEGILQSTDPLTATPVVTRRPSFYAVQTLADTLGADRTSRDREATRPSGRRGRASGYGPASSLED